MGKAGREGRIKERREEMLPTSMPPAAYSEDAGGHPGRGLGTGPDGIAQLRLADILYCSTSPVGGGGGQHPRIWQWSEAQTPMWSHLL